MALRLSNRVMNNCRPLSASTSERTPRKPGGIRSSGAAAPPLRASVRRRCLRMTRPLKSLSTVREHSGREYLQGMTADELFLLIFEDLEERVALGRGEYDALISAWLLRKLLLDEQPLVHRANRS